MRSTRTRRRLLLLTYRNITEPPSGAEHPPTRGAVRRRSARPARDVVGCLKMKRRTVLTWRSLKAIPTPLSPGKGRSVGVWQCMRARRERTSNALSSQADVATAPQSFSERIGNHGVAKRKSAGGGRLPSRPALNLWTNMGRDAPQTPVEPDMTPEERCATPPLTAGMPL